MTGVGSWLYTRLDTVAQVKSGAGFPQRYQGLLKEEYPFFKVGDMNARGNEIEMQIHQHSVSEETRAKLRASAFPPGTIVFPKIGAAIATNKKRVLVVPSCVDNNVMAMVPDERLVESRFLYYLILTNDLSRFASDSNPPSIRASEVEAWSIPLPPLLEQGRIVAILRQADALRQLRRQANERARDLLPALFREMFGDPVEARKGWNKEPLGNFADVASSLVDPTRDQYQNFIHVGSDNIESFTGRFVDLQTIGDVESISGKFLFTHEHVLYSKIRPALVKVATPEFSGLCSADIYPLSFGREMVTRQFLAQLLRSNHFTAYAARVSGRAQIPKINREDLLKYKTNLPDLDSQIEFEERANRINAISRATDDHIQRLNDLFESLLARAFTGELTAAWRAAHADELAAAAAERDWLLNRDKALYTTDPRSGRIADVNADLVTRTIAEMMVPAIQATLVGMATKILEIVVQTAWQSLAEKLRPIAAEDPLTVSGSLSDAMASLNADLISGFASAAQPLGESTSVLLVEAAQESTNLLTLALARDAAEIAAQIVTASRAPAPQSDRAVCKALDVSTIGLLQAAETGPAYFHPKDLVIDGRDEVEVEEGLQLLAALGFVRRVSVRGQYPYRLVDPAQDGVPPESRTDETS